MLVSGSRFRNSAPVLILGMSATGLGALRLLGGAGVACYGVDTHGRTPAYLSRYCCQGTCLPAGATEEEILKALEEISTGLPIQPVLLPTSDRFVSFVSSHRAQLESRFRLLLPDHELVESMLDKQRFSECAEKIGGVVPKSAVLLGLEELPAISRNLGLPIIIKPAIKEHRDAPGVPKVIIIEREKEIDDAVRGFTACSQVPFIAQEYIPGDDLQQLSVAVFLDRQAEVVATFTARKKRQGNLGAGVGTYVETFQDAEAEKIAATLLRSLKYVGVAEVEFKRHAKTGQLFLIEINPRLWTQVALPGACGLNFPYMFYCLATDLALPTLHVQWRSIAWQSLWDDFYNTFRRGGYLAAGKVSLGQWLVQSVRARVGAYFSLHDPLPALAQLRDAAKQVFRLSA